jgi:hypothetical protein
MPTRKQRRRQEKQRRHEWEEVWVDDEGNEIDPPPEAADPGPRRAERPKQRTTTSRGGRPLRQVPPPSWNKVARRGAMFAPVMFALVYYLQKSSNRSFWAALFQTAVLLVFFVPFSYLMDRSMYRAYLKRTGALPPTQPRKKS